MFYRMNETGFAQMLRNYIMKVGDPSDFPPLPRWDMHPPRSLRPPVVSRHVESRRACQTTCGRRSLLSDTSGGSARARSSSILTLQEVSWVHG